MHIPVTARIAWRYLYARKSHSAVTAISAISICGIAVATAAIICVLSVFNGFEGLISGRIETLSPDIMVTPARGKVIANADSLAEVLESRPDIREAVPSLLDNALVIYDGYETPIELKGVDMERYARVTSIDSLLLGKEKIEAETTEGIASVGLASRLNAYPGDQLLLFAPIRDRRVNLANPANSFLTDSITITNVYQSNQQDFDKNRLVISLEAARDLLQYDTEASAIEIAVNPGADVQSIAANIEKTSNGALIAKDRARQQEVSYRMVQIEKWVTFLLLFFILIIASFNIISSLSMLILEKQQSMTILSAMGLSAKAIGRVFEWESMMVTALGGVAGLVLGLALCLLQQHYGLIRLQGDESMLTVTAYPVVVNAMDLLVTMVPLVLISAVSAIISGAFARKRAQK